MPDQIPAPMRAPVITAGSGKVAQVAWATIRTGGQGGAGIFLLNGMEEFGVYHPTQGQRDWLIVSFGMIVAAIQWTLETWRGRKLLGAAPEPATVPPEPLLDEGVILHGHDAEEGVTQVGLVILVTVATVIVVIALMKVFHLLP